MKHRPRQFHDEQRASSLLSELIETFQLDLHGLRLFTEAASGPYVYTSVLSALSGAEKVFAITSDSKYGKKEDVRRNTLEVARRFSVDDRIDVIFDKTEEILGQCDIITNSGFVRPIDENMISWMKPTAVVPLMWETWEYRRSDLDLEACGKNEILVMGTNEHEPPCNMAPYSGFLAVKLIFEMGLEGHKSRIILLGSQPTLGGAIYDHLKTVGCEVKWFGSDSTHQTMKYEEMKSFFKQNGGSYDAMIAAEHKDRRVLLGDDGFLSFKEIGRTNPTIRLGIIAGNISPSELVNSGLYHVPAEIAPFGQMSYQPYILGPRPVLELFAAGLKVGEAMARARLSGLSIADAKASALKKSPAMEF